MNINFSGLSKGYEGKTIFENIRGQISDGDKVGLIGSNGVGKTTLVKVLAGREDRDAGEISYSPTYIKTLYLPQHPEFDKGISVYEDIVKFLFQWTKNNNSEDVSDIDALAKTALNRVGLEEDIWNHHAINLSGGEKTKLVLARIFVCDFDFLVLDEPTNHLDMDSYERLEDFIKSLDKPMLIISHDRFFLDNVVNTIWELTPQGLKVYQGNYTNYKLQKEIEIKNITKEYHKQQTRIQQLKAVISDRKTGIIRPINRWSERLSKSKSKKTCWYFES